MSEKTIAPDDGEPDRCQWCEEEMVPGEGFRFEPEQGAATAAQAGLYCSVPCWLSAS